MPNRKKVIFRILKILVFGYVLICAAAYFFQEIVIFHPDKLDKNYKFSFDQPFEELNINTGEGYEVNGLLFKADSSKGVIFYLHGNTGSIVRWGSVAKRYTDLNYDVFIADYPGFGKSGGSIDSEEKLFRDMQAAYNEIEKRYDENKIVVLGYSIGTGLASKLASDNHPRLLILQAPYYSLTDMMRENYPLIPTFLLRYKFETSRYVKSCSMPVVLFHGDADEVIYYGSSVKLRNELKSTDTLITLKGQGHNGITDNPQYVAAIADVLK
ncbi:MAG: alpha/beta fold hydrolase [Chitinophagaceae bacterium]|nr:alpha/beta fold hydrolase [Chitinophagaceae bacterium]